MKILNNKIHLFLLTSLLVGCMPDSLTKFKKDAEVKPAAPPASTVITTEEGETFDLADVENISNFHYVDSSGNQISSFNLKVNDDFTLQTFADGTYGISPANLKKKLFVGCTISPSLPYGVNLIATSEKTCEITGKPTAKSFLNVSGQLNAPVTYTITLRTRGTDGIISNSITLLDIGVYEEVTSFAYKQGDQLFIKGEFVDANTLNGVEANHNPNTTYVANGFLTSANGITGIIKSIDKEQKTLGVKKLELFRLNGYSVFEAAVASFDANVGLRTPMFICAANGAVAKVIKVPKNFTSDIIHVEMISKTRFLRGTANRIALIKPSVAQLDANPAESLCTVMAPAYGSAISITNDIIAAEYTTGTALDFNIQFYQSQGQLAEIGHAYEMNRAIGTGASAYPALTVNTPAPSKMTNSTNGVVYTVTPPLPAGFSISPTTGELTGTFTTQFSNALYTIIATNPISSTTTAIRLNSLQPPRDLSLTTNQLFSINRLDDISQGLLLEEAVSPPLAANQAKAARVINKYSNLSAAVGERYKLSANINNGKVKYQSRIKIPNSLVVDIPFINADSVVNYNVALVVDSADVDFAAHFPLYAAGGYIKGANNSLARIVYVFNNPASKSVIFAQQIKAPSATTMPRFVSSTTAASNVICRTDLTLADCNDPIRVTSVESNNLVLQFNTTPPIASQFQFHFDTSNSSGKLEEYSTGLYLLNDLGFTPRPSAATTFPEANSRFPAAADRLKYMTPNDQDNADDGAPRTITNSYAATNIFIVERDQYFEIQSNLLNNTYSNFTVTPELPPGITLNSNTGVISGTPTTRSQRLSYLVTAMNLVGQSTFEIELEVKDYLKLKNINELSSQNLHLAGKNKSSRECKIDVNEISKRGYVGTADIFDTSCILDVEESDLFNRGIDLQISVGNEICHDIEFEPYSFSQYVPITTTGKTYYKTTGCIPDTLPPGVISIGAAPDPETNAVCEGNYSRSFGPNCDEGRVMFTEAEYKIDEDSGDCVLNTATTSPIDCGGNPLNCRQGAIRDVITDAEIVRDTTKVYGPAWNQGFKKNYPITAPKLKGLKSNLHIANSIANACTSSRVGTQAMLEFASNASMQDTPLGAGNPYYSFYCKNANGSTLARIKLIVREWDLNYNLTSFIDQFNPDNSLATPALNNENPSGYGVETYNDYKSWDNMLKVGESHPTACASAADISNLGDIYKFPGTDY